MSGYCLCQLVLFMVTSQRGQQRLIEVQLAVSHVAAIFAPQHDSQGIQQSRIYPHFYSLIIVHVYCFDCTIVVLSNDSSMTSLQPTNNTKDHFTTQEWYLAHDQGFMFCFEVYFSGFEAYYCMCESCNIHLHIKSLIE